MDFNNIIHTLVELRAAYQDSRLPLQVHDQACNVSAEDLCYDVSENSISQWLGALLNHCLLLHEDVLRNLPPRETFEYSEGDCDARVKMTTRSGPTDSDGKDNASCICKTNLQEC